MTADPISTILMSIAVKAKTSLARLGIPGAMLARAHRPELEQSLLRVAIGGLVLVYLAFSVYRDSHVTEDEAQVLWVAIGFFAFSIALTLQIVTSGGVSIARRYLGMVADNAVTSYCLIQTGEPGAVIIGVYLFITFGNGFRYGRAYLHACQILSLAGFALVMMMSDFWRAEMSLSIGIADLHSRSAVLCGRARGENNRGEEARG